MQDGPSSPRGSKRKGDDFQASQHTFKRIKALDQDVVNKIAAGEIIVAPVHALKELIENAVDAGSTSLDIVVKDGGLKLLQITDNGQGINKDDLSILCERFTTSKLKTFEDLTSIGTYGFRGEALASISHIAHLTVTTKTAESSCAWRAYYADGRLAPPKPGQSTEPRPTAGRQGTQIKVEDLFYNVVSRQKAFRSPSEEYAKILDVVGRYAIHCNGVAFTCKKQGESATGISTPSNASTINSIRQIYGGSVGNELVNFNVSSDKWAYKASGWASNANYSTKRTTLLLFINHRSVESSTIKKAIERSYATYLPKGGHPFVYISLEIDPRRVDVNVHPTKREVNFLNEDEIVEELCSELREQLANVDTSRTFPTQSLLPSCSLSRPQTVRPKSQSAADPSHGPAKIHESNLVRTDPSLRKITSMLQSTTSDPDSLQPRTAFQPEYQFSPRVRTECAFKSIKQLRAEVREAQHITLSEQLSSLTYVGLVDPTRRIVAIQCGVKLNLVDYGLLSNELFYQIGLADFQNFGAIKFETPLDIAELIRLGVEYERSSEEVPSNTPWDDVPKIVTDQLISKRAMLVEYFSLEISPEGQLIALPLLLKNYTPSLAKLPRFLMRLGPCVNWDDEYGCFHTFLQELASFYTPEQLPAPKTKLSADEEQVEQGKDTTDAEREETTTAAAATTDQDFSDRTKEMEYVLEHVIFPALRSRLIATKGLLKGVIEVADLKGLYKVFERC